MTAANPSSAAQRPELVFALVGGAGTRLNDLERELEEELLTFGYKTVHIKLSRLLERVKGYDLNQTIAGEFERITYHQKMGNEFRRLINNNAAMALAAIGEVQTERARISGSPDRPAQAQAYVLNQLKHPDEVELLRRVYGSSFYLIAGHAPYTTREDELSRRIALSKDKIGQDFRGEANKIITIDQKEDDPSGQNVRDTYPKADFFVNLGLKEESKIRRFVDLLFGHPFYSPKPDEYAMYQANAVSLRSSDDNRQVGAAIVRLIRDEQDNNKIKNTDIIAVGMNEVPRGGGGFYWDQDSPDNREQNLVLRGEDRAKDIKISALTELIQKIIQKDWLHEKFSSKDPRVLSRDLLKDLKGTQFMDIGEFSRPVHAEMAALIDAARRGVAVDGHSMYVTTFPCHNCAKHIIAAGIRRIVYLEPYPKSRAKGLYKEEIIEESLDGKEVNDKLVFFAYAGVAPRQYQLLFSMSERGAKKGKVLTKWNAERSTLIPLYVQQNAALLYLESEKQELKNLQPAVYSGSRS